MGVITIEIPQNVNRKYRIFSESSARKFLSELDTLVQKENKIDDDDILGLWADREKSAAEIAETLRKGWDRTKKNG